MWETQGPKATQERPHESAPEDCSIWIQHWGHLAREQTCEQFNLFLSSRRVHSLILWHSVTVTDVLTNRRITQLSPAQFFFYKITSSNGMVVVLSRFGMLVATPPYVHFPLCSTWAYHIGAQFSDIYLSVFSCQEFLLVPVFLVFKQRSCTNMSLIISF